MWQSIPPAEDTMYILYLIVLPFVCRRLDSNAISSSQALAHVLWCNTQIYLNEDALQDFVVILAWLSGWTSKRQKLSTKSLAGYTSSMTTNVKLQQSLRQPLSVYCGLYYHWIQQSRLDLALQGMQPSRVKDNHYCTLGLELDSSDVQIKQAYRRLAGKWHPDKWAGASVDQQQHARIKFDGIKQAHDTLSIPEERARYDASLFR